MNADVDVIVIGAGVVGLAVARAMARAGREVVVLERHGRAGTETSSRNSGVIHAGLYYPPGSLKARSCVRGRELLYAYCRERGIAHRHTGKLVVATDDDEAEALVALQKNAEANGVSAELRDGAWLTRHEPALDATLALDVAASGIVDPHALMHALKADATDAGALFAFGTEVTGIESAADGWTVVTGDGRGRARCIVNAAGLDADRVAMSAGEDIDALGWRIHWWKGCWLSLDPCAPRPERSLVYPMPVRGGLGIHLTRGLDERILLGPDASPARDREYSVPRDRIAPFAKAVARYLPGVRPEHLTPDYAGLRPKLRADGAFADFVLQERPSGLIHLVGIESPGLTAALALAEQVRVLASRHV